MLADNLPNHYVVLSPWGLYEKSYNVAENRLLLGRPDSDMAVAKLAIDSCFTPPKGFSGQYPSIAKREF